MENYSHVQQPDLRYQYQFGVDQLDQMSECVEAHGFAIVKDVLPKQKIDKDNAPQKSYEESSDTWIDVGYEQKWDESTEEWVRATNLKEVV